jgi:hypothetical protein
MDTKERKRFFGILGLREKGVCQFHLNPDIVGLSCEKGKEGKVRLDQNDGSLLPLAQIPPVLTGKNAEIIVQYKGDVVGQRRQINFIAGTGISITVADDPTNNRINITIAATGGIIPE